MKKLILLMLLLAPIFSFSQTYKCEFLRYVNNHSENTVEAYHSLNTTTTINYYTDGYRVDLESIYEDGEFNVYITVYKGGKEVMAVDYWDADSYPRFFILTYTIPGFDGECSCKRQ